MSSSNVENVAPNVLRKISKELAELASSPPEGIEVFLNEEDISDIKAIIQGPAGTPYQHGSFRVKLILGKSFPSVPPKGYFLTKIFHPNVSRNGEICVNTLKKDWNESLGIKHILLIIKCLLIVPNPESALNQDAAKLLLENYEEYFRRAKMITEIHAKTTGKEKLDMHNDYLISDSMNDSDSSSSSKHKSSTNDLMPLTKRQANSFNTTTNQQSSNQQRSNPIKQTIFNKDKKRTLKRL